MKFSIVSAIAYLTYAAAAPIPEDTAVLRRATVPGVLSFSLEQNSGNFGRSLNKRDSYLSYQAGIADKDYYYSLDLGIGFPQQSYKFLIDTTSPLLWIGNNSDITENPYYFNGDTMLVSRTQNVASRSYFDGSSVNYTSALTQVKVARKTLRNVPIGIAYKTNNIDYLNSTSGYVGLGAGSEILSLLKDQGYTNRTAFSLSLYNDRSTGANIMFGGIDHGKYKGKLWTMPRQDVDGLPKNRYNGVTVKSLSVGKESHDINANALLDAASTFSYVPESVYNALVNYYDVDTSDEAISKYGAPVFDIQKNGKKQSSINIAGAEIKFEGEAIAMPVPPHTHKPKHHRVFGFMPNSENNNVTSFGISVLKSMYVVFDYDGDRIAIAQIDTNPGSTHLIPISDNIKHSTTAPDFQ